MNTALVIVDMLRDFVDGRLANPAAEPTIERIGELADAARSHEDWIVVYGNDAHQPGDLELRLFGEHAMVGTPGPRSSTSSPPRAGTSSCPSATTRHSPRPTWRPPAWCTTSAGS
jgi:nicotinamidase-related amidase